ncbi:MAG TPA: hypothetical protein VNW51_04040 [Mucilaginibacter sp.]|nr:hypothetical protein [Mucilaginibacter sp.]
MKLSLIIWNIYSGAVITPTTGWKSTYIAAANTGHWDRDALECDFSWLEK